MILWIGAVGMRFPGPAGIVTRDEDKAGRYHGSPREERKSVFHAHIFEFASACAGMVPD